MRNFGILTLVGALFFSAIGVSAPLLTLYYQSLGANYQRISLILTSGIVVGFLAGYAWGFLSDRSGRKKPLCIFGLLALAVCTYLIGSADRVEQAWVFHIMAGLFSTAYTTLSLALMADILAQDEEGNRKTAHRGRNMGLYRGLGSLAFAGGAFAGGRIADLYSLSAIFAVCAAFYLLSAIALTFIDEKAMVGQRKLPPNLDNGLQQPEAQNESRLPLLFLAGVALWILSHTASASMWPNYMASIGYTKSSISAIWGLAALIEMPAMYFSGFLSDLIGRALILAGGSFFIAVVNLGYIAFAVILPALLLIQVIRGFGFAGFTAAAMTFVTETGDKHNRGRISGIYQATSSGGQLLGAYLGGTIVQHYGFQLMFGFCTLCAGLSGVCFMLLNRRQRKIKKIY